MRVQPKPDLDAPSRDGQPLDPNLLHEVQAARNIDLSDVRVHVGHEPTHLGVKAFTHANDIYVLPSDLHLVAHEAMHTIQQDGPVDRSDLAPNLVEVSSDNSTPSEAVQ